MFELTGKVVLITGGGSGIGFACAKQLLRNNVKAVSIVDICTSNEKRVLQEIESEFGSNRAIFIKTNVCNAEEFENAFKITIQTFHQIDVLINNASIMNDSDWETEVNVNFNGTVTGCLLALEKYIPKYRKGSEGVVLNVSSSAALLSSPIFPIYTATKLAILGLSRSFGLDSQYQHSQVRFVTLCPGGTDTALMNNCEERTLGPFYQSVLQRILPRIVMQSPENVAKAVVDVIIKGKNGSIWVVERNEPAYEVEIPPLEKLRKIPA